MENVEPFTISSTIMVTLKGIPISFVINAFFLEIRHRHIFQFFSEITNMSLFVFGICSASVLTMVFVLAVLLAHQLVWKLFNLRNVFRDTWSHFITSIYIV